MIIRYLEYIALLVSLPMFEFVLSPSEVVPAFVTRFAEPWRHDAGRLSS